MVGMCMKLLDFFIISWGLGKVVKEKLVGYGIILAKSMLYQSSDGI